MENDAANTQPMSITSRDVLTDILRQGAQRMLAMAIENEVAESILLNINTCETPMDATWLAATAICQAGRFRPAVVM